MLNYKTHQNSMYTLGYNWLLFTLFQEFILNLRKNLFSKEYLKDYVVNYQNSPLIGVGLKNRIKNKLKKNNIFYQPRLNPGYDVIFFLGLIKLDNTQIKKVLNKRIIKNLKL